MEPLVKETYGVIAYQEQVMRLASELAGFSMGQADELRRAMGKKDAAKMQAQRDGFISGCRERGIAEKKATKIFEYMEYFAGYGFPKAHSTTYALLAYQTAYLKANYPRHFMAALLTIESQNSDKVALYLGECRDLGVPVLPPDVNASRWEFAVEPEGVRFGLGAVKGAGEGAIRSILQARDTLGGRITSLYELTEHIELRLVNKKVFESLIKAGTFDGLAPGGRDGYLAWRPRLLAALDRIMDHGGRHQRDREQGQSRLFGGDTESRQPEEAALPTVAAWSETEALAAEKEALGLYITGHPLQRYAEAISAAGGRRLADLTQSEADCAIAGIVSGIRSLKTRKGDRMAVFMLEDEAAKVETVVFPEAFGRYGHFVVNDAMLLVRGKYERDEDTSRLVVSEMTPLDVVREKAVRDVEIRLTGKDLARPVMRELATVLDRHQGDRRVSVVVSVTNGGHPMRVRAATARRIRPSEGFVRDVEAVCGTGSVILR
jgi:DNA polymerase-3 subunit alpha